MSGRASLAILIAVAGCAAPPAPVAAPSPPPPPAARDAPPPADRYFSATLLDFDRDADVAFVESSPKALVAASPGDRVLRGGRTVEIKLSSLLAGRGVPEPWDLLGVRVRTIASTRVQLGLFDRGARRAAASAATVADRWQTVWLNLAALPATTTAPASAPAPDPLVVRIEAAFDLDVAEVTLAQSRLTLLDARSPRTGERVVVGRIGTSFVATIAGRELLRLPAAAFVPGGYRVARADAARVSFVNGAGDARTVDRLGRVSGDAAAMPSIAIAGAAAGRVERDAPGDRDNDGFDESRGCYLVDAGGDARVAFRIDASSTLPADWPSVEVFNLPPGAATALAEGQLVPATRVGEGRVLIELPLRLERPTSVQVRVR